MLKKNKKKVYTANPSIIKKKNETLILHLKSEIIDESDKNREVGEDIECLYTSRINYRLNQDKDIINKLKNNDNDDIGDLLEKMDINKGDPTHDENTKIHHVLHELCDWNTTIEKNCWNCAHKFETIPIGIPISIPKSTNSRIKVRGVFCGFPCVLRYLKDRKELTKYRYLISYLHRILIGTLKLPNEAPVVCSLETFGGCLSINEYRGVDAKMFNYIQYPMYIVKDYIHETEISNIKKSNNYLFK
jgi:hypothetical protein